LGLKKFLLLFYTVRYLKFIQIYYRLYYGIRAKIRQLGGFGYILSVQAAASELVLEESIKSANSLDVDQIKFLNQTYVFDRHIDWNFSGFGKLWTYNLTYFDFLNQQNISREDGLGMIDDFIDQLNCIKDGLEPFPISLRGMNWIKFLTSYKIIDQKINNSLYAQYLILMDNLEYHILGNHLLENGFSLLFGAYYFQDESFYAKAKSILTHELEEQILEDGAHFELSPMYHQLMLFRVFDCINLVKNNSWKKQELLNLLIRKAEIMLGWLNTITYENGNIPLLNDSANKIAPTTKELNDYALNLKLNTAQRGFALEKKLKLSDSGYRKYKSSHYEMLIDVGNIGPDYILGHAHSDTFNFELYIRNRPVLVDAGLSTYEPNKRRQLERSTKLHNTVEVDDENQSEVWGSFRVARRAKIVELKESAGKIEATHDGYKHSGVLHTRKFFIQEDQIVIIDSIKAKKQHKYVAYFHFYPNIDLHVDGNMLAGRDLIINFLDASHIELIDYDYSPEFNVKIQARCAKVLFQHKLETKIKIIKCPEGQNENN